MTGIPSKKCMEEAVQVMVSNPKINNNQEGAVWVPLCSRHVKNTVSGAIIRDLNDWDWDRKASLDKRHQKTYGSSHQHDGKIICNGRDPIPDASRPPPSFPSNVRIHPGETEEIPDDDHNCGSEFMLIGVFKNGDGMGRCNRCKRVFLV